MSGDQIILLVVVSLLSLPYAAICAGHALARCFMDNKTVNFLSAYAAILITVVLLVIVGHLLPSVPAVWQSL